VTYAFLTVFESAVNAVYWFRKSGLIHPSQDTPAYIPTAFYYTFKFVFVLWMALPATQGAQVVFRSLIQPVFARYFEGSGSTAANLRAQAESAGKNM